MVGRGDGNGKVNVYLGGISGTEFTNSAEHCNLFVGSNWTEYGVDIEQLFGMLVVKQGRFDDSSIVYSLCPSTVFGSV